MTTRIKLSNGSYCYSGPNCRLHSLQGVKKAEEARDIAINQFLYGGGGLAALSEARKNLDEAEKIYDATIPGQENLRNLMRGTSDKVEKTKYYLRLQAAVAYAEDLESENETTNSGLVEKIVFPETDGKYEKSIEPHEGYLVFNKPSIHGAKSENAPYDLKSLVTLVRAEIATAVKEGYLPANLKYRVRKEPNSHSKMEVDVQGLSNKASLADPNEDDGWGSTYGNGLTPEAKELKRRLEKVTTVYRVDASNGQFDEYNTNYYYSITFETEKGLENRKHSAALRKERTTGIASQKQIVSDYKTKGDSVFSNVNWESHSEADAYQFGTLPGTKMVVVKSIPTATRPNPVYQLVNLSGRDFVEDETPVRFVKSGWKRNRGFKQYTTVLSKA